MSQFHLLRTRRFGPFFWTQFFGAFNDNVFKNALVILIAFQATPVVISGASLSSNTLINLSAGLFIFPFFLFSSTAGQVADKIEKGRLIRAIKVFEIGIMGLGAVGFHLRNLAVLLGALFLMGTHSALFGPAKYSILPQQLREEELVGGNGLVEMGTFVAILLGTLLGGALIAIPVQGPHVVAGACLGIAVSGWMASRRIPNSPPDAPDLKIRWNPFVETWRTLGYARQTRAVFLSVLGISWFWFYGALFLAQFPLFAKEVLGGDEHVVTLLLAVFSIGIGAGSMLCERLSGKKIELGLVPFGSIGLSLFALDLFLATHSYVPKGPQTVREFVNHAVAWRILADLVLIGIFGGLFIVPLYALVQHRSEKQSRARTIAANNILNALFMVVAALAAIGLRKAGATIPQLFLFTAVTNAVVAVYIYTLLPEFLMRFLIWLLVHTMYRIEERGLEKIPEEGPVLIVANHVSFVDALLIAAASRRPVRFVMDHHIFKIPVLSFIFRTARTIPIASRKEDPEMLEQAFVDIASALRSGDAVCVFPEGQITRSGELNPFRPGVERILAETPVPIVPIALQGLWGSFFSRKHGQAMSSLPRRFRARVGIICGDVIVPEHASADTLQERVHALRGPTS